MQKSFLGRIGSAGLVASGLYFVALVTVPLIAIATSSNTLDIWVYAVGLPGSAIVPLLVYCALGWWAPGFDSDYEIAYGAFTWSLVAMVNLAAVVAVTFALSNRRKRINRERE